ncbi:urease accessory protein UreF [Kutzneria kofuensis]|uniref:Urease accessory protein n=1 Tax=Kutzneria kofuensis TaxID=103725 RepID=A0A7W9NGU2_9PSEU|nr:urease accessory UreF family protein [Kutzneria kofuensis]MBB5892070.1 urease accessory protein [Kutzneria kofuensis]
MSAVLLVLADSRFPGGGHAHSGGVEEAAARGLITDENSLESFLAGRLRTNGLVSAAFAAAAVDGDWSTLDVELDARTPSPAQRAASRAQGKSTLRAGRVAWPSPRLDALSQPHHAIAIGALVHVAGGTAEEAAECAAYLSVSGPASAAVRLLGLDPFRVNAVVARMDLAAVVEEAVKGLPMLGAPALDLFADSHARIHQQEVRLFVS